MPSSHPLLLFSCPQSLPASVFSNESTLCMRWTKYWSFSFSISPSKEIPGLISFRMDWLDLLAVQGALKSLLQHHWSRLPVWEIPRWGNSVFKWCLGFWAAFYVLGGWIFIYTQIQGFLFLFECRGHGGEEEDWLSESSDDQILPDALWGLEGDVADTWPHGRLYFPCSA